MPINVRLASIPAPQKDHAAPVMLSDETMRQRLEKVLTRMHAQQLDQLIIYDDVEHGNNFMYLTGFFTRCEEALLVLNSDGAATLMLGNEVLSIAAFVDSSKYRHIFDVNMRMLAWMLDHPLV